MADAAAMSFLPVGWRVGMLKRQSVLPGFGLSLGYAMTYLSLVVLVPLAGLVVRSAGMGAAAFWAEVGSVRVLDAFRVSFTTSLVAAAVNTVFGLLVAWVLVRYRFPGKRVIDAMVDLPFALPTSVAGIALTTLYSGHGWIGGLLLPLGIKIAFTPFGIIVALTFIGLPFVVRTVQPILQDLNIEQEEAAFSLGATRFQTFRRVILPGILPALITGFALAFARGLGEYGSVIFIAGNIPRISEIVPLLIVMKLEEFNFAGATAIASTMLVFSFLLLLAINLLQSWMRRRHG